MKKTESRMTLTRLAATRLEKAVYAGEYPPDMPLPSTRELARQFGVSQRIILLALDILEKKDILVRQERKQVYVKARSVQDDAKEILFFTFGDSIGMHSIYHAVNEMILRTGRQRKYDFFSRVVSSADALSVQRLDRELSRLENLGFIDCALVYCFLDEERMKKFLKLPYPVVFIGELPDSGKLPEGARMISPDSAELLLSMARYARERNYSRLALAYREDLLRHRYEQEAFRQLRGFCAANRLALEEIPVSGRQIRETAENFERSAAALAGSLPKGTLLAVHNIHSEKFDSGELLPPEKYPGLDFLTESVHHDGRRIKYIERDFSALQDVIVKFIEDPETERHATVKIKYQIKDPGTGAGEAQ